MRSNQQDRGRGTIQGRLDLLPPSSTSVDLLVGEQLDDVFVAERLEVRTKVIEPSFVRLTIAVLARVADEHRAAGRVSVGRHLTPNSAVTTH